MSLKVIQFSQSVSVLLGRNLLLVPFFFCFNGEYDIVRIRVKNFAVVGVVKLLKAGENNHESGNF